MSRDRVTNAGGLLDELGRFEAAVPIAEASTPPASWYRDPAFLELEKATVFQGWQYAGPLAKLEEPRSHVRVDVLDESYVVLRDDEGRLRGFHNACRHHAAQIVDGEGCSAELVCPYHGWVYGLDGRLKSAPRMGAMRNFDRERFGLKPVVVEAWGPLVFLHPGRPERPLAAELVELDARLAAFGMDGLRLVTRRTYPMACNWKVFVDNYLDGGYHIAHLHHGLASQLEMGAYRTEVFDTYSIQTCSAAETPDFQGHDFKERIGTGAIYAWIHPNFMLNRYGPILDTNWVRPVSAESCEVVFDYWYPESLGEGGDEFIELSLAASDRVQQEDVMISESVQRGLRSSSYGRGRYAPDVEVAMHHFHRLLAEAVQG